MRRVLLVGLCASVLAAGGGAPTAAQEPLSPGDIARLSEELAAVNRSLGEIARTLEALLRNQKVDLLIKRIELEERRLSPLGQELRGTRSRVRSSTEEIARLENLLEQEENAIDQMVREGRDAPDSPERQMLPRIEAELKLQREQLEATEHRVIDLENDVARGRDQIAILDEQLQELLESADD